MILALYQLSPLLRKATATFGITSSREDESDLGNYYRNQERPFAVFNQAFRLHDADTKPNLPASRLR
jgi:hypothetical protein